MAINVYCGLMGSGKTYEVVTEVIVPALLKGRNVLTNISGFNRQAIVDYYEKQALDKGVAFDQSKVGAVRFFSNGDVTAPKFYPYDEAATVHDSFVQPGELVVVDEAGRFYLGDAKIPREHYVFFTEHRHFVNEHGATCDIVFIIQDFNLLNRKIRNVVECVFRTQKLKSLGMSSVYNLTVYDGPSVKKVHQISQTKRTYNKDFFAFYKSYHADNAKEQPIDTRQSIFTPRYIASAVAAVLITALMIWGGMRFFDPSTHGLTKPHAKGSTSAPSSATAPGSSPKGQGRPVPSGDESEWRIVGYVGRPPVMMVIAEREGVVRVLNRPGAPVDAQLQFDGKRSVHGSLNGQVIADWTGKAGATVFDSRSDKAKKEGK